MSRAQTAKLYSPELLGLATGLSRYPLSDDLPLRAEARSRSCGSVIALGIALHDDGRLARIGMRVSACAIGQASAAVLAGGATDEADLKLVHSTTTALTKWLAGEGELPAMWPGFAPLAPAFAHPGRHDALLLPWKAACEALSQAEANG